MRVEIVEDRFLDGKEERVKGEVIIAKTVGDEVKLRGWVQVGWAKNLDTGEQGERVAGPNKIDVQSIKQEVVSKV